MRSYFSIGILLFLFSTELTSQVTIIGEWQPGDSLQLHRVVTKDGAWYVGKLVEYGDESCTLLYSNGIKMPFKMEEIDSLIAVEKKPERPVADKNVSERIFISPTGFGLRKGQSEYRNILLFYNAYHYGVTDHFSIGAGTMPVFIFYPFWVDAKLTVDIGDYIHLGFVGVAGGGPVANVFSEDEYEPNWYRAGFLGGGGILTVGNRNNFISLDATKLTFRDNLDDNSNASWMLGVGGSFRLKERLRMVFEVRNNPDDTNQWLPLAGISMATKKSQVLDLGLVFSQDSGRLWPLPIFSFSKRF